MRLQAAQGALAPRAHEQLAILVLLLEDPDREIRETADETLNKIPVEALEKFLARSDVPVDLREFFGDRGIFPGRDPADRGRLRRAADRRSAEPEDDDEDAARRHAGAGGDDLPAAAEGGDEGDAREARDPDPRSEQDDLRRRC